MMVNLRLQHKCSAVLCMCIDFRFWDTVLRYVREHFHFPNGFDLSAVPGSIIHTIVSDSDLGLGVNPVAISCRLHDMDTIILVAHEDCGKYGCSGKFSSREAERAFHIEQMRKAKDLIQAALRFNVQGNGCRRQDGCYRAKKFILLWAYISKDGFRVEIECVEED